MYVLSAESTYTNFKILSIDVHMHESGFFSVFIDAYGHYIKIF